MSKHSLSFFAVVLLSIAAATSAFAADDGNTQPKLTAGTVGNGVGSPQDIISTTSGAGNIKGINCVSLSSSNIGLAHIDFTVNGGTAQTLYLVNTPRLEDNATNFSTGWIPMNVRFTSSIRVQLSGSTGTAVTCFASWALD